MAPAAKAPPANEPAIVIERLNAETIAIPIVGMTPLIMHRFSEKAKRQMLDSQQGRKSPKRFKDPAADYEAAFHRLKDGRPGVPAIAFKQATVSAARFFGKDVTMTSLRQYMFFRGEAGEDGQQMIALIGEPRMREDIVRLGKGSTDLRYRPEFPEWSATLEITYVKTALNRSSVLSLVDAGGLGVGVGEWRPERNGDFGTYTIDETRDVEVIS